MTKYSTNWSVRTDQRLKDIEGTLFNVNQICHGILALVDKDFPMRTADKLQEIKDFVKAAIQTNNNYFDKIKEDWKNGSSGSEVAAAGAERGDQDKPKIISGTSRDR